MLESGQVRVQSGAWGPRSSLAGNSLGLSSRMHRGLVSWADLTQDSSPKRKHRQLLAWNSWLPRWLENLWKAPSPPAVLRGPGRWSWPSLLSLQLGVSRLSCP